MSQENVEAIRRGVEHFEATGEPIWEKMSEDVIVRDLQSPDQAEDTGRERALEAAGLA